MLIAAITMILLTVSGTIPMCYAAPTENYDVTTEQYEVQLTTEETELSTIENKCTHSEGYTYYASTGSCYKVHDDVSNDKTWDDASATCEAEGGHLVVFDDDDEAALLIQVTYKKVIPALYVGLRDYTGYGDWRSVTGKPLYVLHNGWENGRPTGTPEDRLFCGTLQMNGKLESNICTEKLPFICEI